MTTKQTLFQCPVEAALSLLSGKYKCIILWHLLEGTHRYSELQHAIPQATPKMLTQQLRELENTGVISRKVYPVVPPKTEYSLTDFGRTLSPIIESMCDWEKTYMSDRILPKDSSDT